MARPNSKPPTTLTDQDWKLLQMLRTSKPKSQILLKYARYYIIQTAVRPYDEFEGDYWIYHGSRPIHPKPYSSYAGAKFGLANVLGMQITDLNRRVAGSR